MYGEYTYGSVEYGGELPGSITVTMSISTRSAGERSSFIGTVPDERVTSIGGKLPRPPKARPREIRLRIATTERERSSLRIVRHPVSIISIGTKSGNENTRFEGTHRVIELTETTVDDVLSWRHEIEMREEEEIIVLMSSLN